MTHLAETFTYDGDPPVQAPSPWTDDLVARLIAFRADNLTAGQIGERLGVSRNAVIGKLARLGLVTSRPKLTPEEVRARLLERRAIDAEKKRNQRKLTKTNRVIIGGGHVINAVYVKEHFGPVREADVTPRHITLFDLQPNDCRYAYGDSNFTFCGHPVRAGSSYCPEHFNLVFVPPAQRRAA